MSKFLTPPVWYDSEGNLVEILTRITRDGCVSIGEGAIAPVGFFVGQVVPESGVVSYPEGFVPKRNHLYLVDVAVSGIRQKAMIHRSNVDSSSSYFFANFKDAATSSVNTICYKVEWNDLNNSFKISGGNGAELKIFFIYDIALLKDDSQYASTATFDKGGWYEFWNPSDEPFELTLITFGEGEDVQYHGGGIIYNVMGANFKNTNQEKSVTIYYKIGQQENHFSIGAGQSTTFYFTKDIEFLRYAV